MPVIVGALGLIRKGMVLSLGKVPGANNIDEVQKRSIILPETAHIPKRFLSIKQKAPLLPQDQGMVLVLGEYRKQLMTLKTVIIITIIIL